jgi:excinuclease UvrABC nuclease subunit
VSHWKTYTLKNLPSHGGVYVVLSTTTRGRAYYVGQTQNVRQRFQQHKAYPKWPIGAWDTIRIKVMMPSIHGASLMQEARLIRRLQPWYNRRGKN